MMDRMDFELLCHHVEEPGAMCINCAWEVVRRLQASLLAIASIVLSESANLPIEP